MINRPIFTILIILPILLQSCSRRNYPQTTRETSTVTTITEVQRDTIVKVEPDSTMLQALIQCDSTGQAYLREINQLKASSHIRQSLKIEDNILTATVAIDSFDIYLTYKDRYQVTENTTTETQTVNVTTNIIRPWQKMLMYIGALTILIIVLRLFLKHRP